MFLGLWNFGRSRWGVATNGRNFHGNLGIALGAMIRSALEARDDSGRVAFHKKERPGPGLRVRQGGPVQNLEPCASGGEGDMFHRGCRTDFRGTRGQPLALPGIFSEQRLETGSV